MMRRLIAAGANVHAVNNRGQTVAHIALRNSDTWDVIRSQFTLFDHEDADGWTPLALAARLGREECVLEMIAAGANAAYINRDGSSLLHLFLARRANARRSRFHSSAGGVWRRPQLMQTRTVALLLTLQCSMATRS
jgi:hypothetical protein